MDLNELRTRRLVGRRPEPADLAYVTEFGADPEIQRTLFGIIATAEQSRARLQRWCKHWDDHGHGMWIFRDAGGVAIGHAGIFQPDDPALERELGYVVTPAFWQQGFGPEMAAAVIAAGFRDLGFTRIIAQTAPDNAASRRVMEKCGLHFEADTLYNGTLPAVRYAIDIATWKARGASEDPGR